MKKEKKYEGFTIIEVVLVLAIAGLIFLMVFIAWPALQRSQKDTQRRDDMARFISQLSQYQTNNSGSVPDPTKAKYEKFITDYLTLNGKDKFDGPTTNETYKIGNVTVCSNASTCTQKSGTNSDSNPDTIWVYTNATCNKENPEYKKGKNNIAITIKLEGAGIYCGHN